METIENKIDKQEEERKNKVYQDFSTDAERTIYGKLKNILYHFRDNIFPEQFEIIKQKLLYSKEYENELKKHNMKYKSAKIYPLIQSVHDTFMTSLYDNDLRPKVFPMEETDPKVVDDAEMFMQWGIETSDTEEINEIIRNEASLIWRSYWIPWYITKDMKVNKDWEETTETAFIPTLYPVWFFELFYSVGATDFYDAPEKFRRRFIPYSSLKYVFQPIWEDDIVDDKKIKGMGTQLEKKKDAILNYPMPLSKADFTKIYDIDAYSNAYIKNLWDWTPTGTIYDDTFNILDTSSYCEVIDLYIGDQMMVLVNGYFVYSWPSPYYYWEDWMTWMDWPFIELVYEKWQGSMPRGIWHKIMGHQKQCNAMFNSIQDAIYRSLNPVLGTVKWAVTDPISNNAPTTIWFQEGKIYEINPSYAWMNNTIFKMDFVDYNTLSLAMNYFENVKADAYTICWVNSYVLWWEGKVERSRYWAEQRVNASKQRLSPMLKSIGRFYSKLFYHWLWLSKKSWANVAYIQQEDKQYVINLDELDKKMKIVCSANANVEESKANKVQGLLTMMQNTAWFSTNPITQLPDIDNQAFLESIADYAGLRGFKAMTTEEQKKYIDDSYEIKDYIQTKEMELQQKAQQAQPQQQAMPAEWQMQWQPTQAEIDAMMQSAQWQLAPEEELDYIIPQQ